MAISPPGMNLRDFANRLPKKIARPSEVSVATMLPAFTPCSLNIRAMQIRMIAPEMWPAIRLGRLFGLEVADPSAGDE